ERLADLLHTCMQSHESPCRLGQVAHLCAAFAKVGHCSQPNFHFRLLLVINQDPSDFAATIMPKTTPAPLLRFNTGPRTTGHILQLLHPLVLLQSMPPEGPMLTS